MKLIDTFNIKTIKSQIYFLKSRLNPSEQNLIIFLNPGYDIVNGGILSIVSIYNESKMISDIHKSKVLLCSLPGDNIILKYTKFENKALIFTFNEICSYFNDVDQLILHIPEYAIKQFLFFLNKKQQNFLKSIKNLQINILLQNIDYLPTLNDLIRLKKLGYLTCSTAHQKYSNKNMSMILDCPLKKLSVYLSPEQYKFNGFKNKKDLMIVSPDYNDKKNEIISQIKKRFPFLKILIIKNVSYQNYKLIISKAKWAITFGEGLDGYFLETIYSGGVSFAVYNKRFFTPDFKDLKTVYKDYEELFTKICLDIEELNKEDTFKVYQKVEYQLCQKYYQYEKYKENLINFYKKNYDFLNQ